MQAAELPGISVTPVKAQIDFFPKAQEKVLPP
jgi:hypothetical protein